MKALPAGGGDRRRLLLLVGVLAVIAAAYYFFGPTWTGEENPYRPPPPPQVGSGPQGPVPVPRGSAPGRSARTEQMPQPLKLADIEDVPDEPRPGRNLFQWGTRPAPPPPPPPPPPVYTPPPPPPPPPPPQVPLRISAIMTDPYEAGRCRVILQDTNTGAQFEVTGPGIVDGKYPVHSVSCTSVVVSFLDGSGRRTLQGR